jgi:hypothetical protein
MNRSSGDVAYSSALQPLPADVAEVPPVPIGRVLELIVDQNPQPESMELDEDVVPGGMRTLQTESSTAPTV